jgi:hypothetical protein
MTTNVRRLVLYEGWPVPKPLIYALPAAVVTRMNCWPRVIETAWLRRCSGRWRKISDEDMAALRIGPLNRQLDRIILAISFVILAAVVVVVLHWPE